MISKVEYLSIRGERDFLYRYFLKCGGKRIAPQIFNTVLARWIRAKGVDPRQGAQIIMKFLDQKFV